MAEHPFYRLAPFIQEFIYKNEWKSLRAVQVAACETIFDTDCHLLLAATTAAGKTEAAFFPILTDLYENPPATLGALYIGPLKALINDQFQRLEALCAEGDIPVWHRHGDVSQSHKEKMLKNPRGVLQITPESLEALMMHKHGDLVRLFGELRYVVIDEVHALMRADRGGQVLCLLERLERMSGCRPRRIGLSATIGDLDAAGRWLAGNSGRRTIAPKLEAVGTRWRLTLAHFPVSENASDYNRTRRWKLPNALPDEAPPEPVLAETAPDVESPDGAAYDEKAAESGVLANADPGFHYIFDHTAGKKCLIFCNSREEAEMVTTTLRQYCEDMHEPERFLIHHGNLSASYRETAEALMKDDTLTFSTVTTATLELGIDIGRLERAFQVDAPFTVSSFLQRMGRTGRRGDPQEMWFVLREAPPLPRAPIQHHIPWKLLQAIALVQLYLEEKWVEPPREGKRPFSLLFHQTLSTLASCGELTPPQLADRVLRLSPFQNISPDDYRALLRHMLDNDMIQTTADRGLIIGLAGERIVNSYKFYAVFREDEEYAVRWESQELGTLVMPPPVGERVAIAGRVWEVTELDLKKRVLYVEPVRGNVPAYFGLVPGDIHTKVLERMRQALIEDVNYPYLQKNAAQRLYEVRTQVHAAKLLEGSSPRDILFRLGGDMWCLTPWLGTYAFLALERFLRLICGKELSLSGFESSRPYFMQFHMKASEDEFWQIVLRHAAEPDDPMQYLYDGEVPIFEKYDDYVPAELLRRAFAYGVLDIDGAKKRMLEASSAC
ncbi:MAG: DEAD/DEAH box helicase [Clostridiaceae bacterium]|nr:DEAD/DEAH box helicase [Clostridiaceae bacterium]